MGLEVFTPSGWDWRQHAPFSPICQPKPCSVQFDSPSSESAYARFSNSCSTSSGSLRSAKARPGCAGIPKILGHFHFSLSTFRESGVGGAGGRPRHGGLCQRGQGGGRQL